MQRMGHLLAAMISREDLLAEAMLHELEVMERAPVEDADGWGVGFYQGGEVLHRKRPHATAGTLEWPTVIEDLRSHVAIVHVRKATTGDRRADNTHPFRMRQWLLAHIGEVGGYQALRERIVESLPDFLRRNIRGDTDSEHLFHVFLSFLHDAGQLDAQDVSETAVVGALRSTATLLERYAREVGAPPGSLTLAVTNGRQLYALCRGRPLMLVERDRLSLRRSDPVSPERAVDPVRYVLLASRLDERVPPGYRDLRDGEIVAIDRDLTVTSHTL